MSDKPSRVRLDELVVRRGLAESRAQAQRLIMAADVLRGGVPVDRPGSLVPDDVELSLRPGPRYVSRGGLKLAEALSRFSVSPAGWTCADIGASTGGFTDCLLQAGAVRVYAIDVGYGQLAWSLRQDQRVISLERTNIRHLTALATPVALATVDVSFIGLELVLPRVRQLLSGDGQAIVLIKPQFQVGKGLVGKGGVVRDSALRLSAVRQVIASAASVGLNLAGLARSPILGPAGNVEYLAWFRLDGPLPAPVQVEGWLSELEK
jgi:23S rRNA (cytidine1920-2'-O)/16S rRNA (cytidine1409-2'-O)-methyltransferase